MPIIHTLTALNSNYIWLIQPNPANPSCWVVDPGDATPVLNYLHQHQLKLAGILITHHHYDHVDGIEGLLEHAKVDVYGPDTPKIPRITRPLKDHDSFDLLDLKLSVLATPGHTLDHITYITQTQPALIFSGDTLFAGGCGRLLGGSAEQLYRSLKRFSTLSDETLVYCGHEYTEANLAFAHHIEPDNQDIVRRQHIVATLRKENKPTLPSTLGLERSTNPFLRTHLAGVSASVSALYKEKLDDELAVFTALRALKDHF